MSTSNKSVKVDIHRSAMLVALRIRKCGVSKTDKHETASLISRHGILEKSATVVKKLFMTSDLAELNSVVNIAKTLRDKLTLPWNDQGQRMLPTALYNQFQVEMDDLALGFDCAVNEIAQDYDNIKERAKLRLGSLYQEDDYPSDVRSCFDFGVEVYPMPKSDDLRLTTLSGEQNDDVKERIDKAVNAKVGEATSEILKRMFVCVNDLLNGTDGKSGLKNPEARFHKSTITKISDLLDVAHDLNLAEDPAITEMIDKVREIIRPDSLDAEEIRKSPALRKAVADDAQLACETIMETMKGF